MDGPRRHRPRPLGAYEVPRAVQPEPQHVHVGEHIGYPPHRHSRSTTSTFSAFHPATLNWPETWSATRIFTRSANPRATSDHRLELAQDFRSRITREATNALSVASFFDQPCGKLGLSSQNPPSVLLDSLALVIRSV